MNKNNSFIKEAKRSNRIKEKWDAKKKKTFTWLSISPNHETIETFPL